MLFLGLSLGVAGGVFAADAESSLETVIVTGSLIPQAAAETAIPLTVITAEDLQTRGFGTVADALQQSSFATGSVEGPQFTNGFTPGAQTLSMFGLSPSYVKYLIDGRPMSNYPALYDGENVITTLSGIPMALVDHIDILPGGQSSLYGSDAIAGVVNIILKKKLDAPVLDFRYGLQQGGGGADRRIAVADSFRIGPAKLLAGLQYEDVNPIWGYQRPLTSNFYAAGTTPVTADFDYLVYGQFGSANGSFYFLDPNQCSHVAGQFGGSVREYTLPGSGGYCGTTRSGYSTIDNGDESAQGYLHATDDVSERLQLYGDLLVNYEVTNFSNGAQAWYTPDPYYDPNLNDLIGLQHVFSPEEAGGLNSTMNSLINNSYRATLGLHGALGTSAWTYDANLSRVEEILVKHTHVLWNDLLANFFAPILGPNLGPDPFYGAFPTYTPNYAAFYQPVTPAQYASFSGQASSHSQTSDNLLRIQLTNPALFTLPGGPAGLAVVAEGGNEGWDYLPDPAYLEGKVFGYTAVSGGGHRTRWATSTELHMPLLNWLAVNSSARYDDYNVAGGSVAKATYNVGLEIVPLTAVRLRGRYGTAFKAPTLADEFQGPSGYGSSGTDYYRCALQGYTGTNIGNCPYFSSSFLGSTSGNLALKSIAADVWNLGLTWTPVDRLSVSLDYLHWGIRNEVNTQNSDQLLKTEALCRLGTYDSSSPTCVAALSQITRDVTGTLVSVYTPKVNVSREALNVVTSSVGYTQSLSGAGRLSLEMSWSDVLEHTYELYAGDPFIDQLHDPTSSTEFKSKVNASVTWSKGPWSSTVYAYRNGRTPNFVATTSGYGTPGAGTLPPWTLCNVSAQYRWTPAVQLSLAIDNALNAMPPADHSYPGSTSQPYDPFDYNIYGRSYLLEASYKFGK